MIKLNSLNINLKETSSSIGKIDLKNVKIFSIFGSFYHSELILIQQKIGNLDIFHDINRDRSYEFTIYTTDFDNKILEINK